MPKHLLPLLLLCAGLGLAGSAMAVEEAEAGGDEVAGPVDFDRQVREVAERTAAEERAKRDEARKARQAATNQTAAKPADVKPIGESKSLAAGVTGAKPAAEPMRIFKYRKGGTLSFSDSVPYKTRYEVIVYNSCYACSIRSKVDWYNTKLHMTEFADTITQAAREHSVDPALVRAVIHAESAFNPLARSRKGAMGLMQLMPGTAKDMGVFDSSNPAENIRGGVKYLAQLLQKFNGNEALVVAAYNAGPGAVSRHGGIPPFEETQTYVKRVKILLERYKQQKVLATN